jgi:hypothetical protein
MARFALLVVSLVAVVGIVIAGPVLLRTRVLGIITLDSGRMTVPQGTSSTSSHAPRSWSSRLCRERRSHQP